MSIQILNPVRVLDKVTEVIIEIIEQRKRLKEKRIVCRCDNCRKEVEYNPNVICAGPHPTSNWVDVYIRRTVHDKIVLHKKKDYLFCSVKCMQEFDGF